MRESNSLPNSGPRCPSLADSIPGRTFGLRLARRSGFGSGLYPASAKFAVVLFAQFLLSGLLFFGLERAVVSHRDQVVDEFANDRSYLGLLVRGYLGNSLQTL